MPADEETVAADFDFFGANWFCGRQKAELNFEIRSFFHRDRREAIVIESGRTRGFRHGAEDCKVREYVTDASAQLSTHVERSENSTGFREVRGGRVQRNLEMLQRRRNGIVRQAKQQSALVMRKFLAGIRVGYGFAAFRFIHLPRQPQWSELCGRGDIGICLPRGRLRLAAPAENKCAAAALGDSPVNL